MKVNTLHVVVPAGCSNNCLFCVSKMHDVVCNPQPIAIDKIKEKLILAIRKGVSTLVFSSYGEPFLNVPWMETILEINNSLYQSPCPFLIVLQYPLRFLYDYAFCVDIQWKF